MDWLHRDNHQWITLYYGGITQIQTRRCIYKDEKEFSEKYLPNCLIEAENDQIFFNSQCKITNKRIGKGAYFTSNPDYASHFS
jgi:hypothetical protein